MVTREDIQDEAAFVQRLMKLQNPTGTAHSPTPWRKPENNGRLIESETGVTIGYFQRAEDRDLALYFTNAHPAMISLLRNLAAAFAFIGAGTNGNDSGLRNYANQMAESTTIYTDIFCRLGKLAGGDLPMPPEVPAVHILRYGLPLCGFSGKMPVDWPEGHKWVGEDEEGATCEDCKRALKERRQ